MLLNDFFFWSLLQAVLDDELPPRSHRKIHIGVEKGRSSSRPYLRRLFFFFLFFVSLVIRHC